MSKERHALRPCISEGYLVASLLCDPTSTNLCRDATPDASDVKPASGVYLGPSMPTMCLRIKLQSEFSDACQIRTQSRYVL